MPNTLTGKQCSNLLERSAAWLDANRSTGECDLLDVRYGHLQPPGPHATLHMATQDTELVQRTAETPIVMAHDDGPLLVQYGNLFRPLDANRPMASGAVRALAVVALHTKLPICGVSGSYLDSRAVTAPMLSMECVYSDDSNDDVAALTDLLARFTVIVDDQNRYTVLKAYRGPDKIPTDYRIRLDLSPPTSA